MILWTDTKEHLLISYGEREGEEKRGGRRRKGEQKGRRRETGNR